MSGKPLPLPKLGHALIDRVQAFFYPIFWFAKDPGALTKQMQQVSEQVDQAVHFADNFFTWGRNNSMFDDRAFVAAWDGNAENHTDRAIVWRRYVLACAAYHCVHLDGDFVECGCYTGVGVKTVVDYLGGVAFPKDFWIYDLFEHDDSMLHHSLPEHGPELETKVRKKFETYKQVKICKGFIPTVFAGQSPEAIAYLHIDLNQAPAEIAALEALFDRVVPGGIVVLDDYEWSAYRAQKIAEDEWFDARQYRVIPLPTGQGIVIKR